MTSYKKIEEIENKKAELWKKKNSLFEEIDKINRKIEKCDYKISMLLTKTEKEVEINAKRKSESKDYSNRF